MDIEVQSFIQDPLIPVTAKADILNPESELHRARREFHSLISQKEELTARIKEVRNNVSKQLKRQRTILSLSRESQ